MAIALEERPTQPEVEVIYEPRGAIREAFHRQDDELILSGPAGTGKTMGILQKVHLALSRHDGARGLVVRKTLNSLTSSGLVTYRHEVLHPLDIMQGKVHFFSGNKERPAQYEYDNGSVLVVGGLDNPDKVMSTQYDIMAIPESTELSERDWEQLSTRCRNGVMPYQQMLADCNPGPPHHWLKARCDRGDAAMLFSWHRDNPMIYAADGSLTARGIDYMRRLNRLTGVRKKRLLEGKWVAAEGIVYEELDRELHLLNRDQVPKTWQYFVGCDWGFTNAGCLTVWGMDGDGRLYQVEEVYQTRKLIDWWTQQAKRIERKYHPRKYICDPSEPAYILQFEQAGLPVEPGFNEIRPGIEAVQERLQIAGDGRPRLFFARDCLTERDEELAEAFKPICLDQELDSYVWPVAKDGRPLKEVPVDEHNHGCLAGDTAIWTDKGNVLLAAIRPGTRVLTRGGYRPVVAAGMTHHSASVLRVELTNGSAIVGTGNHPVMTGRGWQSLDTLRYDDSVEVIECRAAQDQSILDTNGPKPSSFRAGSTGGIQTLETAMLGISKQRTEVPSTERFTRRSTVRSRLAHTFITATAIPSTTRRATSNAWPSRSTSSGTLSSNRRRCGRSAKRTQHAYAHFRQPGTVAPRGWRGIARMRRKPLRSVSRWSERVTSAARRLAPWGAGRQIASARIRANRHGAGRMAWTMRSEPALPAVTPSPSTNTAPHGRVPVRVRSISAEPDRQPVYNLTVEGDHEYYADGVLVHNCDSLRYVVCYVDKIGEERLTGNQTAVSGPRQIKGLPVGDRMTQRTAPAPLKDIRKDYRIK